MRTFEINSENRASFTSILKAMFRQRKALFVDRLGWANMTVEDGEERDEADADPNVVYLVSVDPRGQLVGSCRLTPTRGLCLLGGPLAHYLDAPITRDLSSWELTRFAPATSPTDPRHGRSFANLATGVLEWALKNDVLIVFGIAEPPLMAIAGGLGWRVKIEGPPVEYEAGKMAFAFSFPADLETLRLTKKALQIDGAVLVEVPDEKELAA
jgi:N-acyl-L-homoserine lactone synthetase